MPYVWALYVCIPDKSEVWQGMLAQAAALTIPALLIAKPLDAIPAIHHILHTCVWRAVTLQILLLFALCVPVQFYVGRDFFRAAGSALVRERERERERDATSFVPPAVRWSSTYLSSSPNPSAYARKPTPHSLVRNLASSVPRPVCLC